MNERERPFLTYIFSGLLSVFFGIVASKFLGDMAVALGLVFGVGLIYRAIWLTAACQEGW